MTGSARYAADADTASRARDRLDQAAAALAAVEDAQRGALAAVLQLWPTSAWLAAGATSAKKWLLAYTHCSAADAHQLERLAGLCHRHPALADAVLTGALPLARAHRLGDVANPEREPWLADSLPALLRLDAGGGTDDAWSDAVRYWASLVDRERDVRQIPRHRLVLAQRLFGGGEVHGDLSPNAFLNVATALDAWTDDPDPTDAPYQRTLSERRADALDDLARYAVTGSDGWDQPDGTGADAADWSDDTFDGWAPTDDLDERLDAGDRDGEEVDPLVAVRRRLRRAECQRRRRVRRRTRARSGIVTNVHIDLRTLAGLRDLHHLDHLILRGDGWRLTKEAAEQLLCDTAMVAVLFDGTGTVLDANDAAETWSRKQRRAITARDAGCLFPGCGRPPRFCDIHHLHREHGGPTRTSNGALLCRFHHRLLHHHRWHLTVEHGRWVAVDPHGTHWTGRPSPIPTTRGDPNTASSGGPPDRPTAKTTG